MNQVTFYKWYKEFDESGEIFAEEPRKGLTSTSGTGFVRNTAAANVREERF